MGLDSIESHFHSQPKLYMGERQMRDNRRRREAMEGRELIGIDILTRIQDIFTYITIMKSRLADSPDRRSRTPPNFSM